MGVDWLVSALDMGSRVSRDECFVCPWMPLSRVKDTAVWTGERSDVMHGHADM